MVYGGIGNHAFDQSVLEIANNLTGLSLKFTHVWHQRFPDGESAFGLEKFQQIPDKDIIIFSCPINDKLENELEDMITACKWQYGAKSVTVVLTFLRYRRQDHEEKQQEITRLRWFIFKLKNIGADRIVVTETHSLKNTRKFCEDCEMKLFVCDPTPQFAEAIKGTISSSGLEKVRIYSPDYGSVGRAITLAKLIGTTVVATPKERLFGDDISISSGFNEQEFISRIHAEYGSEVSVSCNLAEIAGKQLWMREDEISTGGTSVSTSRLLRDHKASGVHLIATHAVCTPGWKMKLFPDNGRQPFNSIWFGNIRPRGDGGSSYEESTGGRINEVDLSPAVAGTLVEVLQQISAES